MKNTRFSFSLLSASLCLLLVFLLFSCTKDESMLSEQNDLTGYNPAMMVANDGLLADDGGSEPPGPPEVNCNCSLEIVDVDVPIPTGSTGGAVGYSFICDYSEIGQNCFAFGAWATDCFEELNPNIDPNCFHQVPTGNTPTYPTGFLPFNFDIPTYSNFNIDTGDIFWFDNDACDINEAYNNGFLIVRIRCCDGLESECQQCYYSDNISMMINTGIHIGQNAPVSLGGICGCEPQG